MCVCVRALVLVRDTNHTHTLPATNQQGSRFSGRCCTMSSPHGTTARGRRRGRGWACTCAASSASPSWHARSLGPRWFWIGTGFLSRVSCSDSWSLHCKSWVLETRVCGCVYVNVYTGCRVSRSVSLSLHCNWLYARTNKGQCAVWQYGSIMIQFHGYIYRISTLIYVQLHGLLSVHTADCQVGIDHTYTNFDWPRCWPHPKEQFFDLP